MPRRVKPIMLLSLVIALILSLGLFAGAQSGGGAVGTALGQVGKPYAFGSDGPGSFSCTGLVRFALRSVGIMDAPWDHHAYLSAYPTVASPEPGDVVVYPDGAAMYIGNDQSSWPTMPMGRSEPIPWVASVSRSALRGLVVEAEQASKRH